MKLLPVLIACALAALPALVQAYVPIVPIDVRCALRAAVPLDRGTGFPPRPIGVTAGIGP
ncbi:MAG: hypothetical protein M3R30_07455 [Candidatus Eremiobacteraeota bacterium]|nr:hypothetical protein [Candidatus Eremiobacteraeota bacterium]